MKNENQIEGRNAVLEAFRSGKTIDRLYIWTAVRTALCGPSPGRRENGIPLSVM